MPLEYRAGGALLSWFDFSPILCYDVCDFSKRVREGLGVSLPDGLL